jgi:Domain of unknown function (DUF4397)
MVPSVRAGQTGPGAVRWAGDGWLGRAPGLEVEEARMRFRSRRLAVVPVWAIGGLLVLAWMATLSWSGAMAQDATPEASPAASPAAGADCGTILAIGGPEVACVAVVHAAPDAPAVDVYLDGQLPPSLTNLPFPFASPFLPVPAGDHTVQVTATGDPAAVAIPDTTLSLEAGMAYEVAATGLLASIAATVNTVDLSPTGADTARVRIVHAIPDGPAVDVAAGGDVLVPNLAFGTTSAYVEVPTDAPLDLQIFAAGDTTTPLLEVPTPQLAAGTATTFYAVGTVTDPTGITVLSVAAPAAEEPEEGTPVASPEASPVV